MARKMFGKIRSTAFSGSVLGAGGWWQAIEILQLVIVDRVLLVIRFVFFARKTVQLLFIERSEPASEVVESIAR